MPLLALTAVKFHQKTEVIMKTRPILSSLLLDLLLFLGVMAGAWAALAWAA